MESLIMIQNPEALEPILFPVREVEVAAIIPPDTQEFYGYYGTPKPPQMQASPRHKAIINEATGEVISIVSNQYKVMPTEQLVAPVLDRLADPKFGTVRVDNVQPYHFDRKFHFDLLFDDIEVTPPDGQPIQFRMNFRGSYDGTTRATVWGGGLRLVCTNGMVIGVNLWNISQRHMGDRALDFLASFPDFVEDMALGGQERLNEYILPIARGQWNNEDRFRALQRVHAQIMLEPEDHVKDVRKAYPFFSPRQARQLVPMVQERSLTPWEQYNVLTDFTSHYQHGRLTEAARTQKQYEAGQAIKEMLVA